MVNETPPSGADESEDLDLILTDWLILHDSHRFLVRYAPAIRSYLRALLGNAPDADDVAHDFFVRVVERGFLHARPERGRFRDYLKVAVRNAAISHLRRQQRRPLLLDALPDVAPDPDAAAGEEWLREWRTCVLDRAWSALERHQRASPGNLCHTVLRVSVDHPDEDSRRLAERVSILAGRPLQAEAFRKQVSRARRLLAQLVVNEVAQTLHEPTSDDILEELAEIGLHDYVVPYLS